jgi:hypothetical protein
MKKSQTQLIVEILEQFFLKRKLFGKKIFYFLKKIQISIQEHYRFNLLILENLICLS